MSIMIIISTIMAIKDTKMIIIIKLIIQVIMQVIQRIKMIIIAQKELGISWISGREWMRKLMRPNLRLRFVNIGLKVPANLEMME